jgi:site-specific DNA-methyltransferase (adenine-specific)
MINLHHIDCMDFMRGLRDKAYELAIVDPPYGIPEAFNGGFASNRTGRKASPFAANMKDWDVLPSAEYFVELRRVSVNQCIWGGNYFDLPPRRGIAAWVKPEQANGDHPFFSHFELLWTSFKKPAKVIKMSTMNGQSDRIHSTQKPVALYKWILKNYASPGDRILDTHGGSMSIAIACYDLGFDLDLCELDKDYFEAGQKRVHDHIAKYTPASDRPVTNKGQLKLF